MMEAGRRFGGEVEGKAQKKQGRGGRMSEEKRPETLEEQRFAGRKRGDGGPLREKSDWLKLDDTFE